MPPTTLFLTLSMFLWHRTLSFPSSLAARGTLPRKLSHLTRSRRCNPNERPDAPAVIMYFSLADRLLAFVDQLPSLSFSLALSILYSFSSRLLTLCASFSAHPPDSASNIHHFRQPFPLSWTTLPILSLLLLPLSLSLSLFLSLCSCYSLTVYNARWAYSFIAHSTGLNCRRQISRSRHSSQIYDPKSLA